MSKESELKNNALALVTEKINKTYGNYMAQYCEGGVKR